MSSVHTRHCCILHGCKYNDSDCPVATGLVKQDYVCERCVMDDGIQTLQELEVVMKKGDHRQQLQAILEKIRDGANGAVWSGYRTLAEEALVLLGKI